jgi:hypothetical protein
MPLLFSFPNRFFYPELRTGQRYFHYAGRLSELFEDSAAAGDDVSAVFFGAEVFAADLFA